MPARHGETSRTRRIAVIGRAGAGKTTVARVLAEAFDLPLIHLDQLAWEPGWRPADPNTVESRHAEAIAGEAWVLDGGYLSRPGWPDRVAGADVIVLVEAPLPVCLWRIVRRGLRPAPAPRPDLPAGCKDELSASFLYWTVTWDRRTRAALAPLRVGAPELPPLIRVRRGEDPCFRGPGASRNPPKRPPADGSRFGTIRAMDRNPSSPGVRERLSYRFDRFMERGTVALILGLAVVSVAIIAAIVLVLVLIRGDEGKTIPELFWMSLMRTLDSGTMGGDEGSPQFLFGMLAVTLTGIFIISTLIGILSNGISDKLAVLRKGRSRVLERDHVLILGWSQQIFPVISELIEAGASRRKTVIVVLADQDRIEMEEAIRERVTTISRRVRIVCRSGRPTSLADLKIGNPDEARAIVVLQSEGDDPDVNVLKTILALTGRPGRRAEPYRIVAEVKDQTSAGIAKLIGGAEVHLLLADELVSRIVAQTCRQSGLSAVYLELLDFAGHELHVAALPDAVGLTFGEAVSRMTGAIPAGVVRDGAACLCPDPARVIEAQDSLVLLAEDHNSHRLDPAAAAVDRAAIVPANDTTPVPERTLILGWNRHAPAVIRELDQYVSPGSYALAVSDLDRVMPESSEMSDLVNIELQARFASTAKRTVLDSLDIPSFDHVVVLCEADDRDPDIADARILLTLLHLRDIGSTCGREFSITSEMLDERNRELAEVAQADDFIVSARVLSLLLAQIAETPELDDVFRDLFDADGAEVYMRDAAAYLQPGREVSFATLQAAAQDRKEIALGYRLAAKATDAAASYGVVLNPTRDARVTLGAGDKIVVLAEA